MDVKLSSETLTVWEEVCDLQKNHTVSAESVVPDSMPDIARIMDADATLYLRSCTAQNGEALLSGEIQGYIFYIGEGETGVRRLEIKIPFEWAEEAELLEANDRLLVSSAVLVAEARAVHARKASLNLEGQVLLRAYRKAEKEITTGAEEEGIELLRREAEVRYNADISDKSFVVSEELALPSASPVLDKLLSFHVEALTGEQKQVGGKMILQGEVTAEILYTAAEAEEPVVERFRVPFSQILDIPFGWEGSAQIELMAENAYIEPVPGAYGSGTVHLEAHLRARSVFQASAKIGYLSDAYCVKNKTKVEQSSLSFPGIARTGQLRDIVRVNLEPNDSPAEILCAYARTGMPSAAGDSVRLPADFHVYYRTERGTLSAIRKREDLILKATGLQSSEVVPDRAELEEIYAVVTGEGIELRAGAEVTCSVPEKSEVCLLTALTVEEEMSEADERPSLTVIRSAGEELWDVAKRYGSTISLIRQANPELSIGDLMLIPRAR